MGLCGPVAGMALKMVIICNRKIRVVSCLIYRLLMARSIEAYTAVGGSLPDALLWRSSLGASVFTGTVSTSYR